MIDAKTMYKDKNPKYVCTKCFVHCTFAEDNERLSHRVIGMPNNLRLKIRCARCPLNDEDVNLHEIVGIHELKLETYTL